MSSWIPPLTRAVPAVALALAVTFSADHSASLGLVTFGIFAAVTGLAMIVVALFGPRGGTRTLSIVQGSVGVLAAIAALTVIGGGLAYLVLLVSAWAVITGSLEVYVGVRARTSTPGTARDSVFVGVATVLLAIAVQLVPPSLSQTFTVDGTEHELTASIVVVGLLGAYWAIIGVYLAIAAASPRRPDESATTPDSPAVAGAAPEDTP